MSETITTISPSGHLVYQSYRDLPLDPEHTRKTIIYLLSALAFWIFMKYVGCYYHWIPATYAKKMSDYDKLIWRHRVISCYHGCFAVLFSIYWYATSFTTESSRRITDYELFMLSHTGVWLFMDTVFMYTAGFLDMGNLLHHTFGFTVYFSIAYYQHDYTPLAIHLLPGELSNLQMNGREILKRMGLRYTKAYYLNEFAYCLTYLFCRIFWIPSIYYLIWTCPSTNPFVLVFYLCHVLMSLYYCMQIPRLLGQRWNEMGKLQKAGELKSLFATVPSEALKKLGVKEFEAYKT